MSQIGPTLDPRVPELEARIAQLEHQIDQLKHLVPFDGFPFTHLCFESGLSAEQERAIYDLMDETLESIRAGAPITHHDFEQRVYGIVPRRHGNYGWAETVVSTLNDEERWTEVYEHFRERGMNFGGGGAPGQPSKRGKRG